MGFRVGQQIVFMVYTYKKHKKYSENCIFFKWLTGL